MYIDNSVYTRFFITLGFFLQLMYMIYYKTNKIYGNAFLILTFGAFFTLYIENINKLNKKWSINIYLRLIAAICMLLISLISLNVIVI